MAESAYPLIYKGEEVADLEDWFADTWLLSGDIYWDAGRRAYFFEDGVDPEPLLDCLGITS